MTLFNTGTGTDNPSVPDNKQVPPGTPEKTPESGTTPTPESRRVEMMTEVQKEQLRKLEQEKAPKERRQLALQTEAQGPKATESWLNDAPRTRGTDTQAIAKLKDRVEQEFSNRAADFAKYNVGADNIAILKEAAVDLIFARYQRTNDEKMDPFGLIIAGSEKETEGWVKQNLVPKITGLFDKMTAIMGDSRYGFKNAMEVLQSFSDFNKANLVSAGKINKDPLKNFLVYEPAVYTQLADKFTEYLNLGIDVKNINAEIDKILPGKSREVPVAPSTPPVQPQNPETASSTPPVTPNVPQPAPNIPANQPSSTPTSIPSVPNTPTKVTSNPGKFTGNASIDNILGFLQTNSPGFFKIISTILGFLGFKISPELEEFNGLSEDEKKEAKIFKEIALKYDLKKENLATLLRTPDQTQRILKNMKDSSAKDWDTYLTTYLDSDEQNKLKNSTSFTPKNIADMLTSKVGQGQNPAQKPTVPPTPQATAPAPGTTVNPPQAPSTPQT